MFLNFTIFGGARPLEFKSYTTSVYIAIDQSTIYQDKSHYYYSQQGKRRRKKCKYIIKHEQESTTNV